jgi:hypothetical protein
MQELVAEKVPDNLPVKVTVPDCPEAVSVSVKVSV